MDRKKAIALSFSVPVAWGFSYPLMKIGMDSMNATSIVALRCIVAFAACLLLFHKRALRINRDLMVRAAIIGAIMATELTCMCLGSSLTSASTAGFLQSLTVVIVPFANAALLRRAPERKVLIGTAIVTCGMLLLSGADFTSLNPGALIMLLSAFIYAGHIIVAKRFVEEVDPLSLGVWQLGFGGLFSGIAACVFGGFTLPSTPARSWSSLPSRSSALPTALSPRHSCSPTCLPRPLASPSRSSRSAPPSFRSSWSARS